MFNLEFATEPQEVPGEDASARVPHLKKQADLARFLIQEAAAAANIGVTQQPEHRPCIRTRAATRQRQSELQGQSQATAIAGFLLSARRTCLTLVCVRISCLVPGRWDLIAQGVLRRPVGDQPHRAGRKGISAKKLDQDHPAMALGMTQPA